MILDVRQPQEWAAGHIEKAVHITGAELPGRIDEVPSFNGVPNMSSVAANHILMSHSY